MTAEVSHGRGGAGNINADDTKYVDGEVVRTGVEGSHGDGAYSSGRGGAGNIADIGEPTTVRKDRDVIPEVAVRPSLDNQDFHTGRGGAGNEHTAPNGHHHKNGHNDDKKIEPETLAAADTVNGAAESAPVSLADKLKDKLFGAFKK